MLRDVLDRIDRGLPLGRQDLRTLLLAESPADHAAVIAKAGEIRKRQLGNTVYLRGLIEVSNICAKDCYYCGIRKSNPGIVRYQMSEQEVLEEAEWIWCQRFGSLVLQGGENTSSEFIALIERLVRAIRDLSHGELGITLSMGEQSEATYRRWLAAGAHRYLLRIETSDPKLYSQIHPRDPAHSWETRRDCLRRLRDVGYQVGTGVMIGLPFQTVDDLVDDLVFFQEMDIDMIGMGPYVIHHETPLAKMAPEFSARKKEEQLCLALRMIAAARILLPDVNIATATALQALRDDGRDQGIQAGANVIMPNVTETRYRRSYQLYDNKPGLDDAGGETWDRIRTRIEALGYTIGYNQWGDSQHFHRRQPKS